MKQLPQQLCEMTYFLLPSITVMEFITLLSLVDVKVSILQQLADDRLDVFTNITSLRQCRTVTDGKWYVQTPCQDLCQERLTCTQWDINTTVIHHTMM